MNTKMECQHSLVIDEGQQVCQHCGSIFDKYIDEGAEWRNYEDGKEKISVVRVLQPLIFYQNLPMDV